MVGGKISYSLFPNYAVVKLIKRITWEMSGELNALFLCLLKELQLSILYIEMSETNYVDSTILGILVQIKKRSDDQSVKVIISSPAEVCEALLTDVGLNKIFEISKDNPPQIGILKEIPLGKTMTILEIELLIKSAHEELMNLNEHNRELFSPVVDILNNEKS